MFRDGYASKILADVVRIIAEEKRLGNNDKTDEAEGKIDKNKQDTEEKKDEDTN